VGSDVAVEPDGAGVVCYFDAEGPGAESTRVEPGVGAWSGEGGLRDRVTAGEGEFDDGAVGRCYGRWGEREPWANGDFYLSSSETADEKNCECSEHHFFLFLDERQVLVGGRGVKRRGEKKVIGWVGANHGFL